MKSIKVILVISFIVSFKVQSYGQVYKPIFKIGNRWQYLQTDWTTICGVSSGKEYFVSGDTLINGFIYHKVSYSNLLSDNLSSQFCPPLHVDTIEHALNTYLYREDSIMKKVYQYDGVLDNLIMDFSLEVGDTLFNNYYSFLNGSYPVVDSLFYINLLNNDTALEYHFSNGAQIIEGVGNICGLVIDSNFTYCDYLICLTNSGSSLYSSTYSAFYGCYSHTGLNDLEEPAVKLVVMNNIVKLFNDSSQCDYRVTVFNSLGQVIMKSIMNSSSIMDISHLTPDIYYYQLVNGKTSKLISGTLVR